MTVQDDGYGPPIPYRPPVSDALSRTFQHGLATWSGGDFEDEIKDYVEDHGEPPPTLDAEVMPGALPIAYEGCGEWCYLSVSGPEAGMVWEWANGWMSPVPTQWLRPVNFTEWILGEVARHRGLIDEFRRLAGVAPPPRPTPTE
ncbi:MAG: SMI1/KNR4 family protein [Deltaproteobacteria bacterium]|nr:SMI1/KNR4 family protein [Deltaproteobacteria bacterium]